MKNKLTTSCKDIRSKLTRMASNYIGFDAAWIQKHIASCPRCQRRFASIGKVYLAMSLLKSKPHQLDLLKQANVQTIDTLAHSVRHVHKAEKLRNIQPEPSLFEKLSPIKGPIANTAACIVILFISKAGIFNSIEKFQADSQKVVENYYERNIGSELSDEIFS